MSCNLEIRSAIERTIIIANDCAITRRIKLKNRPTRKRNARTTGGEFWKDNLSRVEDPTSIIITTADNHNTREQRETLELYRASPRRLEIISSNVRPKFIRYNGVINVLNANRLTALESHAIVPVRERSDCSSTRNNEDPRISQRKEEQAKR